MAKLLLTSLAITGIAITGAAQAGAGDLRLDGFTSATNNLFMYDHYPAESLARGEHGAVAYAVKIDRRGAIQECRITRSSGFRRLDLGTCDIMVRYARFEPRRDQDGRAASSIQTGTVTWMLGANAPVPPAPTPVRLASAGDDSRLVCKRSPKVGSLYVKIRQCLTEADWSRQDDQSRRTLSELTIQGGHAGL